LPRVAVSGAHKFTDLPAASVPVFVQLPVEPQSECTMHVGVHFPAMQSSPESTAQSLAVLHDVAAGAGLGP
jgi:hypothetical protein